MKEHIKYVLLLLFIAFNIKILVFGASWQDTLIFTTLAGLTITVINKEETPTLVSFSARLEELENNSVESKKETEELRSHVSSIKLGQQVRSSVKF